VKDNSDRILFLDVDEVDWIEGARDYVRLHSGARSHLVRSTMNSISQKLDPNAFIRIHRSAIVRIDAIKEMSPLFHGDYAVILHDGTELRLSRRYLRLVHGMLGFGF
jgi:two-component system LytT family response regulator